MRLLGLALAIILAVDVSGCGGHEAKAMPDVTGKRLDVAKKDIKSAGIDESVKVDGGGIFGVIDDSNWIVCSQSPAAGKPVSAKPEVKVDRSCEDDTAAASPSTTATQSAETPAATPTESAVPDVITAENTPTFSRLLKVGDSCDGSIAKFAKQYQGDKIQFAGSVVNIAPHGSYKTRYDYLLGPGDKGPNTVLGPAFKYENVNYYDFNVTGKKQPDSLNVGDKFLFTATVDHFNAAQCLFFLTPDETRAR